VLALADVAASRYGVARAAGLADRERRADLVEHSIGRGDGDPDFAEALRRAAEGRLGVTLAICLGRYDSADQL